MDEDNRNELNENINEPQTAGGTVPPYTAPDEETLKKQNSKKKQAVVVIVGISVITLLIIAVIVAFVIKAVSKKNEPPIQESEIPFSETVTDLTDVSETQIISESEISNTEIPSESDIKPTEAVLVTEKNPKTTAKASDNAKKPHKEPPTVEGLPPLTQTGDNILSDSPDNKFVKAVCEKYGTPCDNVVAIYAIPDKGNNFVLEFDGTKDSSGKVIKSPDTLFKVHQIDLKGNIKTATGKRSGNVGVTYYEGLMVFYMVTNIVMPQYPDYFTGVK